MKSTISLLALALCLLAVPPSGRAETIEGFQDIPIFLRIRGGTANIRATPAGWRYFLSIRINEEGKPMVQVCSSQKVTGSRILRNNCTRRAASLGVPWIAQNALFFEYIAAFAATRQLKQGTLDLNTRPLFVDVTEELADLNIVPFVFR